MAKARFCVQCHLDFECRASQTRNMAHSYIRLDFGTDEEKAQQARHKLDGWKQAFPGQKAAVQGGPSRERLGRERFEARSGSKFGAGGEIQGKSRGKDQEQGSFR